MGGFGNTLFQLLIFLHLKKNLPTHAIKINTYLINSNRVTRFLNWSIHDQTIYKLLSIFAIDSENRFRIIPLTGAFISKFIRKSFMGVTFEEKHSLLKIQHSNHLFGYFQDKNLTSQLLPEYTELKHRINKDILRVNESATTNQVVVHFRWGDSDWAKVNLNYYKKVREIILERKLSFIIVTDDPPKAKKFFAKCNVLETFKGEVIEDFQLMVGSSILFSAPSTFSWWAAQFQHEDSISYIPKFVYDRLNTFKKKNIVVI